MIINIKRVALDLNLLQQHNHLLVRAVLILDMIQQQMNLVLLMNMVEFLLISNRIPALIIGWIKLININRRKNINA